MSFFFPFCGLFEIGEKANNYRVIYTACACLMYCHGNWSVSNISNFRIYFSSDIKIRNRYITCKFGFGIVPSLSVVRSMGENKGARGSRCRLDPMEFGTTRIRLKSLAVLGTPWNAMIKDLSKIRDIQCNGGPKPPLTTV